MPGKILNLPGYIKLLKHLEPQHLVLALRKLAFFANDDVAVRAKAVVISFSFSLS